MVQRLRLGIKNRKENKNKPGIIRFEDRPPVLFNVTSVYVDSKS
jgi:hypothetical protein